MYDCFILSKVRGSETKYIDKIYFDDSDILNITYTIEVYNIDDEEKEREYLRFKRKKDLKRFLIINTYHL